MAAEWNDRLLPRARAGELAGDWPVRLDVTGVELVATPRLFLRCERCGQSCGDFTEGVTSPDDVLAAVLRHAVTAHDLALSGRSAHG